MCSLDLDCAKVWNETPRIARKEHGCDGCHAAIPKGDAYLHHSSLYDGRWTTEAMCFPCWWVRETFAEAHGQSFTPGMLMETLRECMLRVPAWERRQVPEPDRWAPELASVLRRYRTSKANREHLAWLWMRRALRRERALALRILEARTQLSPARADN